LGGGMRQAGVLAAAGLVAVDTMVDRLAIDHARARAFAEAVADAPGLRVDLACVHTNMVYVQVAGAEAFTRALAAAGVLANAFGPTAIRFVTHFDLQERDVETAAAVVREMATRAALAA